MKKIFLLLFFAAFSFASQAQEQVWHTDLQKAVQLSEKSDKPLLLFFTGSDWCGWCIRLQKEVFKTAEFSEWAKSNVILVELDFPRRTPITPELKKQNGELQQFFGVRGYPTIWLTNVNQNKKDKNISFEKLGSTGYVAGGPTAWLAGANQILAQKKT